VNTKDTAIHVSEITYELPKHISKQTGTFLFTAYGCVLFERPVSGGLYVYTATNLKTGRSQILSRRKVRIGRDKFAALVAKVRASAICGNGRFLVDKNPNEKPDRAAVMETANHIFREILPQHGYTVRERQIELMHPTSSPLCWPNVGG